MVLTPLLFGAGLGLGMWVCIRVLAPRPEPIHTVLANLDRPGRPLTATDTAEESTVAQRAETFASSLLGPLGLTAQHRAALELTGRSTGRHALDKLLYSVAGLLAPALVTVGLSLVGVAVPGAMAIVLCLVCAAAGFVLPDLALRDEGTRRRRAFRHALSAYLDLVCILLAGGAGIETALYAAADAGDGWAFSRLRHALDRARRTGRSPWDTFTDLGATLGVSELSELAASVSLAGSHGARIRASLAAKADALRGHQVAETEAAAESATERMSIPLTVLLFGFLVLVGYPAIQQVTTATGM